MGNARCEQSYRGELFSLEQLVFQTNLEGNVVHDDDAAIDLVRGVHEGDDAYIYGQTHAAAGFQVKPVNVANALQYPSLRSGNSVNGRNDIRGEKILDRGIPYLLPPRIVKFLKGAVTGSDLPFQVQDQHRNVNAFQDVFRVDLQPLQFQRLDLHRAIEAGIFQRDGGVTGQCAQQVEILAGEM